ncbi:MAG: hypothetical protein K1X79_01590 [Oligoflexia bacterium]|nr:hypothetical protein [Oligoflexia bacterium]
MITNPNYQENTDEPDFLDERWMGKTLRIHVREFACVMTLVLTIIAGVVAWKHGSLATVCSLLLTGFFMLLAGYRRPRILHPVWKAWMTLAMGLGVIMTTLLLSLGWMLAMIPLALALKLAGKKVMDLSYKSDVESYWETRKEKYHDFKLLERQF